ncbi:hypothetical protein VTN02DRAFT_3716 [Thermoascus thermophilus]
MMVRKRLTLLYLPDCCYLDIIIVAIQDDQGNCGIHPDSTCHRKRESVCQRMRLRMRMETRDGHQGGKNWHPDSSGDCLSLASLRAAGLPVGSVHDNEDPQQATGGRFDMEARDCHGWQPAVSATCCGILLVVYRQRASPGPEYRVQDLRRLQADTGMAVVAYMPEPEGSSRSWRYRRRLPWSWRSGSSTAGHRHPHRQATVFFDLRLALPSY